MAHIEGYVSKKNVIRWLENYGSLEAGDQIDDGQVKIVNSGPKQTDGVSGGRLNKIMLDQALGQLRKELSFSFYCVRFHYIRPILQKEALRILNVRRPVFIRGLEQGQEFLYREINGKAAEEKARLEGLQAAHGLLLAKIKSVKVEA
jgi:fimbrial chaperone protein